MVENNNLSSSLAKKSRKHWQRGIYSCAKCRLCSTLEKAQQMIQDIQERCVPLKGRLEARPATALAACTSRHYGLSGHV